MEVSDYIAILELAQSQLTSFGVQAELRGVNPPNIGSFLFVTSAEGAVEISIDSDHWFVEFWTADSDYPVEEATLPTIEEAINATKKWLLRE